MSCQSSKSWLARGVMFRNRLLSRRDVVISAPTRVIYGFVVFRKAETAAHGLHLAELKSSSSDSEPVFTTRSVLHSATLYFPTSHK